MWEKIKKEEVILVGHIEDFSGEMVVFQNTTFVIMRGIFLDGVKGRLINTIV